MPFVELLAHLVIDPMQPDHAIFSLELLLGNAELAKLLEGSLILRVIWSPAAICSCMYARSVGKLVRIISLETRQNRIDCDTICNGSPAPMRLIQWQ